MTLMLTLTLNVVCHPYYQNKLIWFQKYKLLLLMLLKSFILLKISILFWLNCVFPWEYLFELGAHNALWHNVLQRPPVWHQAWQCKDTSHKNVRFLLIIILPAKQWIARQIIGILTRTKHGSHATQPRSVFADLPDHLLSRDPLLTQVWPGNLCTLTPLSPLLIITNPWPGDHWVIRREEVKLPAAMLSQVTPDSLWVSQWMGI